MTIGGKWIREHFVSVYLIAVFSGLPLYLHDKLYDISTAKFSYIVYVTLSFFIVWLLVENKHLKDLLRSGWEKKDILYGVFLFCAVISTMICDYPAKAFTGSAGRNLGLFTCIIYACAALMVITAGSLSDQVFFPWGLASCVAGVIGILNHFGIDPFGFFERMYDYQIPLFMSTMGNVDFFSGYMAFVFVFFGCLLIKEKIVWKRISYGGVAAVAAFSVSCCRADCGYIMIILFAVFGWMLADSMDEMLGFVLCICEISTAIAVTGWMNCKVTSAISLDGVGLLLTTSCIPAVIAAFCILLFVAGLFLNYHLMDSGSANCHALRVKKVVELVVLIFVIGGIAVFCVTNFTNLCVKGDGVLSMIFQKLKITDDFGATRGYVWRKTIEYYCKLPVKNKIFGIGPDMAIFAYDSILYVNPTVDLPAVFNNAHNELLQLLLTHGLLGVLSYYGWIISSAISMLKVRRQKTLAGACAFSVLCYLAMMQVCVNVVYLTFIPFLILCIGKNSKI